jgi:hypothetical protein
MYFRIGTFAVSANIIPLWSWSPSLLNQIVTGSAVTS